MHRNHYHQRKPIIMPPAAKPATANATASATLSDAAAAAAVTSPTIAAPPAPAPTPAVPAPAVVAPPPPPFIAPPPPPKNRWLQKGNQRVVWARDLATEQGWVEVDDNGVPLVAIVKAGKITYSTNPQFDTDVPVDVVRLVELSNKEGLRAWLFGAGLYEVAGPQGAVVKVMNAEYHDLKTAVIALELRRETAARASRVAASESKG